MAGMALGMRSQLPPFFTPSPKAGGRQRMTNVAAGQKADPEGQKPEMMVCRTRNSRRRVVLVVNVTEAVLS